MHRQQWCLAAAAWRVLRTDRMPKEAVEPELEARFSQTAITSQQFAERLLRSGVVDKELLQNAWRELPQGQRSAAQLADRLIAKRELTAFQAICAVEQEKPLLKLGAYVLVDRLGEGGMGQVYRAIHQKMKREVAIKVISTKVLKDENTIRRFGREVEAAARLSHPNIVTAHDAGEVDGVHYLVMESVRGKDLSAVVREKGRLSLRHGVDYTLQAARGLAYAHQQGITHRDIKPANMLLDHQGVLKILDMGLARIEQESDASVADGLTGTGMVMGTIDYMAPEQAFDSKVADGRSDIYSLGCTLCFLLTGQSVFGGDTVLKRILAHRDQPVPDLRQRLPSMPPELQAVFEKMVAKRPENRFQTLDEAIPLLERILVSLPATANAADVGNQGYSAALEGTVALGAPLAETCVSPAAVDPGVTAAAVREATSPMMASPATVSPVSAIPSEPASRDESFSIQIDAQPPRRARMPRSAEASNANPKAKSSGAKVKIAFAGGLAAILLLATYGLFMPRSSSTVASGSASNVEPTEVTVVDPEPTTAPDLNANSLLQETAPDAPTDSLGRSMTELDFNSQAEEMESDSTSAGMLNADVEPLSAPEFGTVAPSDASIPPNDMASRSSMNREGEAVQGGRTLVVGVGPGEMATLDEALQAARPNDTILIRLSGPVEVHPTDLTGKSPLTIAGDSANGVDYWPIVRHCYFDPSDTRLNELSAAWFFGDHLDLTFKKVHLGVGGRYRQPLGAVFQCQSGTLRFEECTLTASADDGRTTAVGNTLPLVQLIASANSVLDVQIEKSFMRGGRLAELVHCQSSAKVQLRVSGSIWAGGPAHTVRFNGENSEANVTIDRSTLYNINGLCQVSRAAEVASSPVPFQFTVNQSLLVGNSSGNAQLFAVAESGATAMSSEVARATFTWQGSASVLHRIDRFFPAGERSRISFEDFASLLQIQANELVSVDPILRCYPSGIELQECEPRDFESRLLASSRRVKNLPAKIGVSGDDVPHVLACVMERAIPESQTVAVPKGVPRVLVVDQKAGPYRTLEEAFADFRDDDIIEISDDATYTPARNFDLVSVRGVLNVDKPMFVHLRAARDKKPTIVLNDGAQRGTYPKFHQDDVPHNYCLFLMSLNSQSVRIDGIRFRTELIGNTHHSFIHTTASTLRITNCQFIDLSPAPHAMVMFYWNNGVAYIEPVDWQTSLRRSQPHGSLTWIENCIVVNPVARKPLPIDIRTSDIAFNMTGSVSPRHIAMRNVAIGENLIGLYDETTSQREFVKVENCTVLGRPIAFVQERGGVEYRFDNNLVISHDNPIPAEPGGLIARLPSFGNSNAVWLLNGLLSPEQRNSGSLRMLPGPVLKGAPQATGRYANDDVLKPFRLRVTVARQTGNQVAETFGIHPEYFTTR